MIGIATAGERTRFIEDSDVLWLARSLYGEGGRTDRTERLALAATMVRGWMLSQTASLGTWVQGFSQPVNPRWLRGGDKWVQHTAALASGSAPASQASLVSAEAHDRRVANRARSWGSMPAALRADVLGLLNGTLPMSELAPDAVDFGGPMLYRGRWGLDTSSLARRVATAPAAVRGRETARGVSEPRYVHVSPKPGANVFHSTAQSREASVHVRAGTTPRPVTLPAPAPAPVDSSGLPLGAVLVVLLVGVALWQSGAFA